MAKTSRNEGDMKTPLRMAGSGANGKNRTACFAARAAGQAVATAHVAQHAFGGAYYALKAIAADPAQDEVKVAQEHGWQVQHMPAKLRPEVIKRVIVQKRNNGIFITVHKDEEF